MTEKTVINLGVAGCIGSGTTTFITADNIEHELRKKDKLIQKKKAKIEKLQRELRELDPDGVMEITMPGFRIIQHPGSRTGVIGNNSNVVIKM